MEVGCCLLRVFAIYTVFMLVSPRVHKVYTPHVNSGKGSLKKFAERPNLGGLSWNRFLLLVGPIALLSMRLTIYVLDDWTVIIPMVICLAEVYILFFFLAYNMPSP